MTQTTTYLCLLLEHFVALAVPVKGLFELLWGREIGREGDVCESPTTSPREVVWSSRKSFTYLFLEERIALVL
jgi:hypothetical protein